MPAGASATLLSASILHSDMPTECPVAYAMVDGTNNALIKAGLTLESNNEITLNDGYEIDPA